MPSAGASGPQMEVLVAVPLQNCHGHSDHYERAMEGAMSEQGFTGTDVNWESVICRHSLIVLVDFNDHGSPLSNRV